MKKILFDCLISDMVVYQLLFDSDPQKSIAKLRKFIDLSVVNIEQITNIKVADIEVDYQFMLSKYQFKLSDAEIGCYCTHMKAWQHFLTSRRSWCLIIEDIAFPRIQFSKIQEKINNVPVDWDVFFPFDYDEKKRGNSNTEEKITGPYLLGHHWGSYAYFLSSKGVLKLLQSKIIRQPVDEEILACIMQRKIIGYAEQTFFFKTNKKMLAAVEKERRDAIKNAISNLNVWTKSEKLSVQNILRILDNLSAALNIDLILDSGSLLGHVRHNQIIPWDDDVDLAIERSQLQKLVNYIKDNSVLQYASFVWPVSGTSYYKVWLENGEKIENYPYSFPFVDLWPFVINDENVTFDDRRVFPVKSFYPLKEIEFEFSRFKVPNDSMKCLDIHYFEWRTKIEIYKWSHKLEKRKNYPLSINIEVDKNGRLIS